LTKSQGKLFIANFAFGLHHCLVVLQATLYHLF